MPFRSRGTSGVIAVCLLHALGLIRPTSSNSGLLSRTLYTFQEAVCDGEPMKMSCPQGMLVNIQFAQYGRQVPSSQMCPKLIQGDDPSPGTAWRLRSNALWEDTNCLATTSLKVILEHCQDKQKCHLVASAKTFQQDPCPGTRKYLEVAYKCRPNEFSSETVCEGDQLEVRCGKATRIAIYSGMFGRTHTGDLKCPELIRNTSTLKTTCQSDVVMEALMKECHGRKTCLLEAEEYMFGNPCPKGVNKYLNVVYTCVPKRVLTPLRRHHHRKHRKKKPGEDDASADKDSSQNIPSKDSTQAPNNAENFPADAAQENPQQHPSDPSIGKSKQSQGSKGNSNPGSTSGKGVKIQTGGKTTPCANQTGTGNQFNGPTATGLLTDWLNAFNFIIRNKEKALLYLVLGVAFGVICLLFLVIIRLAIVNKRKSKAKLDITEPTHEDHPAPSHHIEAPTLERSDSVDRIEVVRFNPMRSRDFATCTLRSDIGNRSLTNYYG